MQRRAPSCIDFVLRTPGYESLLARCPRSKLGRASTGRHLAILGAAHHQPSLNGAHRFFRDLHHTIPVPELLCEPDGDRSEHTEHRSWTHEKCPSSP